MYLGAAGLTQLLAILRVKYLNSVQILCTVAQTQLLVAYFMYSTYD